MLAAHAWGHNALDNIAFGSECRRLWRLEEAKIFLNHGSFGACPKLIRERQDDIRAELDSRPDQFFLADIAPLHDETAIRRALRPIAAFLRVGTDNLAFVENATIGLQTALRSVHLEPGDRILCTNHEYGAVTRLIAERCRESGAAPLRLVIRNGASDDEILTAVHQALKQGAAVGLLDHVTSSTAIRLPIERIARLFRDRNVPLIVDGAHAIGQVELDLSALDADWYVTNAHKWLYAPTGSAIMFAADRAVERTLAPVVSHWTTLGFPRSFDYIGSRDYSAWLATPIALEFHEALSRQGLAGYCRDILALADRSLRPLGIVPYGGQSGLSMRAYVLPQHRPAEPEDCDALHASLWHNHAIQARFNLFESELLLRVSAQAYVDASDIIALCEALKGDGWPGRQA